MLGNILGTHWEVKGTPWNTMETIWKLGGNSKFA